MKSLGFDSHDHAACIRQAVDSATELSKARGVQFTPIRKRVLELLLEEHRALGAYAILELLREEGHAAQPPVAYRALDFLVSNGFAHRIERLNAFVACAHPGEDHNAAFLICRSCMMVAETHGVRPMLDTAAEAVGFTVEAAVVEAEGLCSKCRDLEDR